MKTIFLDFDGVLFDTVLEAYLLARYAYHGIEPTVPVNESEYKIFYIVRHLITNSWHYYYIMKLISNKTDLKDFNQKYKNMIKNRDETADLKFDKIFQQKRQKLIKNHFKFWNQLDKPYPFFYEIKSMSNELNIIIVSTKNKEAVFKHCQDYKFNIEEKNIIGKTELKKYGSKRVFLEYYMSKYNLKKSLFIDDNVSTVKDCSNIPNLKSIAANWGYIADKRDGFDEKEIINIIKEM